MLDLPHVEPPRDQWGRPKIDGRSYTRVTTLAKALDDQGALIKWGARMAALGLAKSEDLIAAIATTDPDDRQALNKIVEVAQDRAGSTAKATIGTAIHVATDTLDRGGDLDGLPSSVKAQAHAYRAACQRRGLVPLASEVFVVCDEVNAAGTLDRLFQSPFRVLIGDLKTSASDDAAKYGGLAWAVQLAVYAHGKPWLPGRGIVTWGDLGLPEPNQQRGVIIHAQQGTGQVVLHSVDLTIGWEAAKLADEILAFRKMKNVTTEIP